MAEETTEEMVGFVDYEGLEVLKALLDKGIIHVGNAAPKVKVVGKVWFNSLNGAIKSYIGKDTAGNDIWKDYSSGSTTEGVTEEYVKKAMIRAMIL